MCRIENFVTIIFVILKNKNGPIQYVTGDNFQYQISKP